MLISISHKCVRWYESPYRKVMILTGFILSFMEAHTIIKIFITCFLLGPKITMDPW